MSCVNHTEVMDHTGPCERCSLPFCPNCLVVFQSKQLCGPCKGERIRAIQSGTPEGELRIASVARRFRAVWVDGMVLLIPLFLLAFAVGATGLMAPGSPMFGLTNIVIYVAPIFYEGFFLRRTGQTPGKKWLGVKVVNPDGSDISSGQAWGRAAGKTLVNFCLGIGYLPAFFTKDRTCVHDILAKTRVVRV